MSGWFGMYKSVAENFVPILKETQFVQKGVLTPEEFIVAGDELIKKCGTWAWSGCDKTRTVAWLPADKQYLVTRNVPCMKRAAAYQMADAKEQVVEDEWVETHVGMELKKEEDAPIADLDEEAKAASPKKVAEPAKPAESKKPADDIPDLGDEPDDQALSPAPARKAPEDEDDAVLVDQHNENLLSIRTYDLTITYDRYYQTPRFWLFGYDETRQPLARDDVMADISTEHAHKTVTIDPHPHLGIECASIHPCKHSSTMKKIVDNIIESGRQPRVEFYMFYFLKFISSVIPTIEYDYTLDIGQ